MFFIVLPPLHLDCVWLQAPNMCLQCEHPLGSRPRVARLEHISALLKCFQLIRRHRTDALRGTAWGSLDACTHSQSSPSASADVLSRQQQRQHPASQSHHGMHHPRSCSHQLIVHATSAAAIAQPVLLSGINGTLHLECLPIFSALTEQQVPPCRPSPLLDPWQSPVMHLKMLLGPQPGIDSQQR